MQLTPQCASSCFPSNTCFQANQSRIQIVLGYIHSFVTGGFLLIDQLTVYFLAFTSRRERKMSASEMNADQEMDSFGEEELLKDDSPHNHKLLESLSDIKEVMINFQSSMQTMGMAITKLASDKCDEDGPPKKKARMEPSKLNEDDMDVNNLLSSAEGKEEGKEEAIHDEDENDILCKINSELNADDCGKEVSAGLAKIVDRRFEAKLGFELLKEKLDLYKRPANCNKLVVPDLNDELKDSVNQIQLKRDRRLGYMQAALIKAAIAVTEVADDLLKVTSADKSFNGAIRKATDAIALMGHIHSELSQQRKFQLKPALSFEYKRLCNQGTPVTNLLFGDNISKAMADAKQVSSLAKKAVPTT